MGKFSEALLAPAAEPLPVEPPRKSYSERLLEPRTSMDQPGPAQPIADPEKSSGILTNMAAATMFPQQQIVFYASKRFPGEDIEDAVKRYKVSGGRVMYKGRDGQTYYEDDSTLDQLAMATVETGVPVATGLAGMLAGSPAGPIGAAGGGIMGAAAGDAAKRFVGDMMAPEMSSLLDKLYSASMEGLLDVGGTAAGSLIVKGIKSKPLKELSRYAQAEAETLIQVAKNRFGIDLSLGEASNLKSLLRRQQFLNRTGDAGDKLQDRYLSRMGDINNAVDDFLRQVSPTGSAVEATNLARDASEESIRSLRKAISDEVAPLYQQAYRETGPIDVDNVVGMVQRKAGVLAGEAQASMRQVANVLRNGEVVRTSLEELHNSRMAIDDLIDRAQKGEVPGWSGANMRHLTEVREALDAKLKDAHPAFREADETFARRTQTESVPLARSVVGDIARQRTDDVAAIGRKLFNRDAIDETAFTAARDRITAENPEAWDSIVRWHLQNEWNRVMKGAKPGEVRDIGGRFSRAVFGDGKQQTLMREALANRPQVQSTFDTLMEVLNATSRGLREGSPTQPLQEEARQAGREAAQSTGIARMVGAGRYLSADIVKDLSARFSDISAGKYNSRFADAIFEPEFQQAMAFIQAVGPKTRAGVQASARFLLQWLDDAINGTERIRERVETRQAGMRTKRVSPSKTPRTTETPQALAR